MAGKVRVSTSALVGGAGEHFVLGELLKRGVTAHQTPYNARAYDILATINQKMVRIRVKTKSGAYAHWQWNASEDGEIFKDLSQNSDFTVLVNLAENREDMEFFVIPTYVLDGWLKSGYSQWLSTPGRGGRQHKEHTYRAMKYSDVATELERYRDHWDILWE